MPDFIIYDEWSKKLIACIGVKKSFRERWKGDDRDALLRERFYSDVLWVEFTSSECLESEYNYALRESTWDSIAVGVGSENNQFTYSNKKLQNCLESVFAQPHILPISDKKEFSIYKEKEFGK